MKFDLDIVKAFERETGYTVANTEEKSQRVVTKLYQLAKEGVPVAIDTEYDSMTGQIQCWSLASDKDFVVVVESGMTPIFTPWLEDKSAKKVLQNFVADEEVFDNENVKLLGLIGDTLIMDFNMDETDREHNLKHAAMKWLKKKMMGGFKEVFSYVPEGMKKPIMYSWAEIWKDHQETLLYYSADDPVATILLFHHHRKNLKKSYRVFRPHTKETTDINYWDIYRSEDLPFTLALTNVRKRGMLIDEPVLKEIRTHVLIDKLRAEYVFRELCGKPDINLRSVPQMKQLFFEELGLPGIKRTKTEKDNDADTMTCMDKEVLDIWSTDKRIKKASPKGAILAEVLLANRGLTTLDGTFLSGVLNGLEKDGRLYSDLNQIGAITGRISSRKYTEEVEQEYTTKGGEDRTRIVKIKRGANLQNMPAREDKDPYGMRRCFIAPKGKQLVVVDMAGFEWWLMADVSEDGVMLTQNHKGINPHSQTAAVVFELACSIDEVKTKYPDKRQQGKNLNFALLYGAQAKKAMKLTGVTDDEGEMQSFIDKFFALYEGVREYHTKVIRFAQRHGYVTTISGRKVRMPDIKSHEDFKRSHEENRARNAPVQGSAADIIKSIMNMAEFGVQGYRRFPVLLGDAAKIQKVKEAAERADHLRRKLGAVVLNQVHDELIWEVPEENAKEALEHGIFMMSNNRYAPVLHVNLPAEGNIGDNWKSAKEG